MDVIRCDEPDYLVWKWRPGDGAPTNKENSIRWGSSLRVKDGEAAVFIYKQESGPAQDFIEGPYDETLKTANFPVLASIMGLAFDGKSPFQAEVYFINLAGIIRRPFRSPWFSAFDPRFNDFMVPVAAEGSYAFRIKDYKSFIKLHRLIEFDLERFSLQVRDAVVKYVKAVIANAPADAGIPVLQLERRILEVGDLVEQRVRRAFEQDFGVELVRFDLSTIAFDTDAPGYKELRAVTADLHKVTLEQQTVSNVQNIQDMQAINAQNMAESMRIQRDRAERFAALQTEQQFIGAHQINQQTKVLEAAANNLGEMGQMNTSGGGPGGFNPIGVMTGLAVGGMMGSQMASMMGAAGQGMQNGMNMPPPIPQLAFFVAVNGQNTGPFNMQQLQGLALQGQLLPTSYVWRQGMPNWELAGSVADLLGLFAQQTQPPPVPPMPPTPGGAL
ncbi:SPFH domain-containing protein [Caenimonas koreensis]|nr:SPFH domain-containing protein [Caenimonas koreensis]